MAKNEYDVELSRGQVINGHEYQGGNFYDERNWKKVDDADDTAVHPTKLDWHKYKVKQDSQSFGRKAKDLGGAVVDRGRDVAGGLMKGVVGVGQAVKGVYDFVDTNTDGGLAITPVGYGLKALDAVTGQNNYQNAVNSQKQGRQKAMNAINSYVDNSDGFAGDYLRALGFGDSTQDVKGFGNAVSQNITNTVQSQGLRDQIARRQEQNALETRRWDSLPESEKTFGKRLGHLGLYAKNALNNPLATMDDVVVSGSEMATGGRVLKGVNFGLKALQGTKAGAKAVKALGGEGAVKAGLTEGLIAGGHAVADVKSELGDDFDKTAANKAGLVGLTTGAISLGGNRLGRALGIADIDEMLIAGAKNTAKGTGGKLGRIGAVGKGAVQEGLLEELPQGMAETALQNWATGKPITEGMAENAISGAIAGGLMGGAGGGLHYQATPDKGFGFSPASRVKPKEMKKYADSIERQQQALAKNIYSIYGDPTDLDSEDARVNQHISRQATKGYGLGVLGQREVDMSAMQHYNTPSTLLGLRRDYQGGGALENTAALAVDIGASSQFSGSLNNDEIVRNATKNAQDIISRLGLSAYTQQNDNEMVGKNAHPTSVSGSLFPQSQLGDDLMNTPTDNSVISSRSSSRVVKGATGRKGGSTGATGGNITISNPPKTRLDGLQGFGSGQTITNSNALKTPTQYTAKEQETIRRIESTPNKGRDMAVIGRENFTPNMVDYVLKSDRKVAVDTLSPEKAKALGYKHTDTVRRTISRNAVEHTLNRHGENSENVKKGGQKAVTKQHIANWTKYTDNADRVIKTTDNLGQTVTVSGKQINGYSVIVETVSKGQNELAFKSMYFEKGSVHNSNAFNRKNPVAVLGTPDKGASGQAVASRPPLRPQTQQQGISTGRKTDSTTSVVGSPKNTGSGVSANGRSGYEPEPKLDLHSPTVNRTIPQTKPLINQGFSASESSVKQGVKQSPRLKANLRRQFNTAENRVQLDRQKVLNTPDLSAHAKRISKENIIPINANSKEEALKVRDIYGWDKTHTPLQEAASGKWHLVKNTAWNKAKAEQAMVSDAVAKVQNATAKIEKQVNQAKTKTATPDHKPTSQAVASSSVPTTSQTQTQGKEAYYIHTNTQKEALREAEKLGVLQTHTPHRDYESGKYILVRNDLIKNPTQTQKRLMEKYKNAAKKANHPIQTAKNTQNETKNATILGSKAKITAKNDKILQKSAEKRGDKAKSQDKQAEIQRLKDEYEQAKKGKFAAGMAYRLGETELEMRKIHAKNGEKHQSDYAHLSEEKLNQQIAKYKAEESEYEKQQAKISNQIAQLAVGNDYGNANLPYIDENTGKFNAHQFVEIVNDKSKSLDERRLAARHLLQAAFNNQQSSLVEDNLNMSKAVDKIMQMAKNGKVQPTKEFSEEIKRIVQSSAYKSNSIPDGTIANLILKFAENPKDYAYANLMPVSQDEINEAKQHGLNISGHVHLIDTDAIRHINREHGDEETERNRGQIAIKANDYVLIPEITSNPDKRIYGGKTNDGLNTIVSVKRLEDGSTVVVEEVRTGRKKLAVKTMYKHTAATDTSSIIKNIEHSQSNAQSDSGRVVTDIKAQTVPKDNQSSVSNKSVSQSKKAKDDKQDKVSGKAD